MQACATTRTLILPGPEVVVAGDWHENVEWARDALRAAGRRSKTILHVGDFGLYDGSGYLAAIDAAALAAGVDTIAVTPGNHEDWGALSRLFSAHPGQAVRVSEVVWVLPPAFVLHAAGRTLMSLGGAASTNFLQLCHGVNWWPEEVISDSDVDRAIRTGWVDIMLTHDTIHNTGIGAVDALAADGSSLSRIAVDYSSAARDRVTRAYRAIGPTLLFHGHMHVAGSSGKPGGRRVFSLGRDGDQLGNIVTVELDTLTVMQVPVFARRAIETVPRDAALMWA